MAVTVKYMTQWHTHKGTDAPWQPSDHGCGCSVRLHRRGCSNTSLTQTFFVNMMQRCQRLQPKSPYKTCCALFFVSQALKTDTRIRPSRVSATKMQWINPGRVLYLHQLDNVHMVQFFEDGNLLIDPLQRTQDLGLLAQGGFGPSWRWATCGARHKHTKWFIYWQSYLTRVRQEISADMVLLITGSDEVENVRDIRIKSESFILYIHIQQVKAN